MQFEKRYHLKPRRKICTVLNKRGKEQLGVNGEHQGVNHTMQEVSRKMTFLSAGTNCACHTQSVLGLVIWLCEYYSDH